MRRSLGKPGRRSDSPWWLGKQPRQMLQSLRSASRAPGGHSALHHVTAGTSGRWWPKGTGMQQTELVFTTHRMQHFFHHTGGNGRATPESQHLSTASPGKLSLQAAASSPIHRATKDRSGSPVSPCHGQPAGRTPSPAAQQRGTQSCSSTEQGFATPAIPLLGSSAAVGRLPPLPQPSCLWPWSCMALRLLHAWKALRSGLKIA